MVMTKEEVIEYLSENGPPLGFLIGDLIDDFEFNCKKKADAGEVVDYLEIANWLLEPE